MPEQQSIIIEAYRENPNQNFGPYLERLLTKAQKKAILDRHPKTA